MQVNSTSRKTARLVEYADSTVAFSRKIPSQPTQAIRLRVMLLMTDAAKMTQGLIDQSINRLTFRSGSFKVKASAPAVKIARPSSWNN